MTDNIPLNQLPKALQQRWHQGMDKLLDGVDDERIERWQRIGDVTQSVFEEYGAMTPLALSVIVSERMPDITAKDIDGAFAHFARVAKLKAEVIEANKEHR